MWIKLLNILSILSLCSCALVDKRDYETQMDEFRIDDPMFIAGEDFEITSGDSGESFRSYETVIDRTPPSFRTQEDMVHARSIASELDSLKQTMAQREYAQYERIERILGSDSEKIYYINLSYQEKLSYMELKGLKVPNQRAASRSIASVSNESMLKVGMSMSDVINRLGYPNRKEVADQMNERWVYGSSDEPQYVYFAKAQVEGWD